MHTTDNRRSANSATPLIAVHPGSIIKDELEFRGVSQKQLAKEIGVSYSLFNEVLNGKRALNPEIALLIEAATGMEAQPLLRIQLDYNLQQTKSSKSFLDRIASIRRVAAVM